MKILAVDDEKIALEGLISAIREVEPSAEIWGFRKVSQVLNGIVWIARSGAPWRDLPERYGSWQTVYSRFRKWIEDGILDNIFRVLSLEAELTELSIEASIVKAHQHSAGAKKGGLQTKSDTAVVEPAQKSMRL